MTDNQRRHFSCAIFAYPTDPMLNRNYLVSTKGLCRSWTLTSA